ncbi:DF family (seleno)protein [Nakamurella panacisegetis]|nr:hypothetical protein [Nakamurella panacisegetis]
MKVELLVVPGCRHTDPAYALLQQVLADLRVGAAVSTVTVSTAEQAQQLRFLGSPTILIDGVDPFPQPGQRPALACRLYPGVDGPAGLPARAALSSALTRAAQPSFPAVPTSAPSQEQRQRSEAAPAITDITSGR